MRVTIQPVKFLMLLLVFALGSALLSTSVAAQDERWQIQRADYGYRSQRTDVTDILRDLISRGGVNGRVVVNNQTMGGDPAVGRDKTLRIFARNRRDETREFDFREGGFIDVQLFELRHDDREDRGPGHDEGDRNEHDRGDQGRDDHDHGGRPVARDLFIVRGYYGVQGQSVNVTDRLQSMVRDGVLEMWVNNQNLGGDPAIGADKVLIVIYRSNGREQATAVHEGNRLVLP